MIDFEEAIDRLVAGLERKSRVISPKEKEIVAYHEAGHALVAESRVHADRVAKISIIPRGVAALGYTQQQPTEDRYLMTRALIDAEIQQVLEAAHSRVHETLTAQRALLESLGKLLMVHEVVDRNALIRLLGTVEPEETPQAPMGQERTEDPGGAITPLGTPTYDRV